MKGFCFFGKEERGRWSYLVAFANRLPTLFLSPCALSNCGGSTAFFGTCHSSNWWKLGEGGLSMLPRFESSRMLSLWSDLRGVWFLLGVLLQEHSISWRCMHLVPSKGFSPTPISGIFLFSGLSLQNFPHLVSGPHHPLALLKLSIVSPFQYPTALILNLSLPMNLEGNGAIPSKSKRGSNRGSSQLSLLVQTSWHLTRDQLHAIKTAYDFHCRFSKVAKEEMDMMENVVKKQRQHGTKEQLET